MTDSSSEKSSTKNNGKRAISGAEVVLLVLLVIVGMGMWVWVEREFTELFHDREPNEEKLMVTRGVGKKQNELTQTQNEVTQVQKQLNDAQLDQLKQSATVKSLTTIYPHLAKTETEPTASIPAETLKTYQDARIQTLVAKEVVGSLNQRLDALKSKADKDASELENSKLAASEDFHRARAFYIVVKPTVTFAVTLAAVLLVLLVVRLGIWLVARERISIAHSSVPFLVGLAALFVLLGYQAFEVAGAAFVGIGLLLILLSKIKWPKKSDEASTALK